MKIIYPDQITAVTCLLEDSNFPASNVLTDFPKEVLMGTATSISIDVAASANASSVMLAGMKAKSVAITVYDSTKSTILVEEQIFDLLGYETLTGSLTSSDDFYSTSLWYDFADDAYIEEDIIVSITLTHDTNFPEIGIIRCGPQIILSNPTYGLQESLEDYSIITKLRDGSQYINDLGRAYKYNGSIEVERGTDIYYFLRHMSKYIGKKPMPFLIINIDGGSLEERAVFGSFETLPSFTYDFFSHSQIPFTIIESI